MTIAQRTKAIYQEVVALAIDLEADAVTKAGQRIQDRRLARMFGGDAAMVRELRRLRERNAAARHLDLGAYHNALLYAVLPGTIEVINEAHASGEPMPFCGRRYIVRRIDVEMFVGQFFEDTDFELPQDVVNELGAAGTAALGLDDAVFGVVNALAPHADELQPRHESADAVVEMVEPPPTRPGSAAATRSTRRAPATRSRRWARSTARRVVPVLAAVARRPRARHRGQLLTTNRALSTVRREHPDRSVRRLSVPAWGGPGATRSRERASPPRHSRRTARDTAPQPKNETAPWLFTAGRVRPLLRAEVAPRAGRECELLLGWPAPASPSASGRVTSSA